MASALWVSGEKLAINLTQAGIPSTGQIIPDNSIAGKTDPTVTSIASFSSLTIDEINKPWDFYTNIS